VHLNVKYSLFLSDLNKTWIFSTDFQKTLKYWISWNSVQWETNCFRQTNRQTARYNKANSLWQFCECTNIMILKG